MSRKCPKRQKLSYKTKNVQTDPKYPTWATQDQLLKDHRGPSRAVQATQSFTKLSRAKFVSLLMFIELLTQLRIIAKS